MKFNYNVSPIIAVIVFFSIMLMIAISASGQATHSEPIPDSYIRETGIWKVNPFYEEINTLSDMIEWMDEDIHNDQIPEGLGTLYIKNIQQVIKKLEKTPPVVYKQYQYINEEETPVVTSGGSNNK